MYWSVSYFASGFSMDQFFNSKTQYEFEYSSFCCLSRCFKLSQMRWDKSEFVNLLRSPGINSQSSGPVREPYLTYRPARDGIFKLVRSPGIDYQAGGPGPAVREPYLTYRPDRYVIFKLLRSPGIDSASLCSLAGLCDNPIPTPFLAPIDCSKIRAHST